MLDKIGGLDTVRKPSADIEMLNGKNVMTTSCAPEGVPSLMTIIARVSSMSLQFIALVNPTVALHATDGCAEAGVILFPVTVIVLLM